MQELKRKHSSQSYFLVHHQVIQGSLSSFIIISTGYSSLYVPSFTYHNSSLVTGIKQCFSPTFTLYQLLGWAAWFRSPIYCDAVTEMLSVYSSQSLSITAWRESSESGWQNPAVQLSIFCSSIIWRSVVAVSLSHWSMFPNPRGVDWWLYS